MKVLRQMVGVKKTLGSGVFLCLLLMAECQVQEEMTKLRKVTKLIKPGPQGEMHIGEDFDFQIFCRRADPKNFYYYFRTATLRLISSAEDIKLIKGHSPATVLREYEETSRWSFWVANFLPWRARDTNFPTFNTSCIGVATSRPYTAVLLVKPLDMWKIATLAAGITIFLWAPNLTQSSAFFYSSGTLLGAVGTVLLFLYIVYRFLPKSKTGAITMSILWTIIVYIAGETWSHLEELLQQRLPYIIAVITGGSLVSFILCYRFGPPTNPRSIDIYRWSLQFIGLILMHWSSDLVEMSSAIIIGCVIWYNCSSFFKRKFWHAWYKFMPQRVQTRFITEEEFIQQGAVETIKALDELKSFCSSPEVNPWKIVTRLKDPKKFCSFVDGDSHLDDEEVLAHDMFVNESTDEDEEDVDEQLNDRRFGRSLREERSGSVQSAQRRTPSTSANIPRGSTSSRGRMSFTSSSTMQNGTNGSQIHNKYKGTRTSLPARPAPARSTIYPNLSSESLLTDDEEPQHNLETDDDE